jgi:hypothetical protein
MTSRHARVFVAVLVAFSLAGTGTAFAHKKHKITLFQKQVFGALHDCANSSNGSLKGHYSLKVLQTALHDVKAEALQYTGCATVLIAAIRADTIGKPKAPSSSTKTTHTGTATGTAPATKPARQPVIHSRQKQIKSRVDKLGQEGGSPLTLPIGRTVTPGTVTAHSAGFLSTLPTALLIVLAALLAAVVAVSGRALQNVVRARRTR